MLICLDLSVPQLEGAEKDELRYIVTQLLLSHRYGHHLLVVNRDQSSWISENLDLDNRTKATLSAVRSDYTQSAHLIRQATTYMAIVPTCRPWIARNGRAIQISLDRAANPRVLSRVALVFEDIATDAPLYKTIINAFTSQRGLPPTNWEPVHGGGERVSEVWRTLIGDRRVVGAIIDSDHDFPRGRVPTKVLRLRRIATEENWPLAATASPLCREAENLIPLTVMGQLPCAQRKAQEISLLRLLDEGEKQNNVSVDQKCWLYIDLKVGSNIESTDEECKAWYEQKAALVDVEINDWRWTGFGPSVISQVLSNGQHLKSLRKAVRSGDYDHVFDADFEDLVWCCAARATSLT